MKYKLLKSVILKAKVTEANLNYIGSITIDEDLLDKANLNSGENVLVVDHTNGARLETYIIVGKRDSGIICMNGAAAHLINANDSVTIMAFTWSEREIIPNFVRVNKQNRFAGYQEVGK